MGRYGSPFYQMGKRYCKMCGEFKKPWENEIFYNHAGRPMCSTCGYQIRLRGRGFHRYAKPAEAPKRY